MEIVIISALVLAILTLHKPIAYLFHQLYVRHQYRHFLAKETFYHAIVSRYVKYYNRLGLEEQRKFLFRTYLFKNAKHFHYIEVEESAEMPILISAVAVQLSFGLEKFMLNYFDDIFVLRDDYHYGFYSRPFMGHVDQTGIYLSWDNFMKGLCGQTPNCNVGLHEMGHALAYVNFITQTEEDKHFKKEFLNFSKVARPIFKSMQDGYKNLLGDYASTNYHEFWAVAVELFFENPVRFKHDLPELYESMVRVLNQDPLNYSNGKVILINRSSQKKTAITKA
ncbi:MAG: zinc-dependent peptidase [Bacteroidetes bacterium]|nr:zinc-dependent peptidase [Bacteroidota bacterium]MBS1933578.1 zinc-dependent peptidase [Bacteroidota bacterium]